MDYTNVKKIIIIFLIFQEYFLSNLFDQEPDLYDPLESFKSSFYNQNDNNELNEINLELEKHKEKFKIFELDKNSKIETNITEIKKDLNSINNKEKEIKKINVRFLGNKTKRSEQNDIKIEKNIKIKNDKKHTKNNFDNIIKKVKYYLLKYLILSINHLIKKYNPDKKYTLLKLAYKICEQLDRDSNLELLRKPIKNVISGEISGKYKCDNKQNEKIIKSLLKDENNNVIIKEILNITFSEWLEYFREKKNKDINGIRITFDGYEDLIKQIKEKNDDECYNKLFEEMIKNYENYFNRKRKNKIKSKSI